MTAEEHIALQLCAALDVEPTQTQWGDLVGVLIRYKHVQKIATSHLERELMAARTAQHRMREALSHIAAQESLTFAECSVAEEIVRRAKAALDQH